MNESETNPLQTSRAGRFERKPCEAQGTINNEGPSGLSSNAIHLWLERLNELRAPGQRESVRLCGHIRAFAAVPLFRQVAVRAYAGSC
jgi:hypothetical protein